MMGVVGILVFIGMAIYETFFEPSINEKKYIKYHKEQERITGIKWDGK